MTHQLTLKDLYSMPVQLPVQTFELIQINVKNSFLTNCTSYAYAKY